MEIFGTVCHLPLHTVDVSNENVSCENLSGDAATESLWSVGQVKGHKKPKVYLAY